jgi:preprotein translocase subunit YajC
MHPLELFAFQAQNAADAAPAAPEGPGLGGMLFPLALVLVAFYFIVFLPESRKSKKRQEMIAAIKKGDQVLTSSGILGIVANIKDQTVTLKVDEARGTTIEFAKSSVVEVLKQRGGEAEEGKS